MPQPPPDVTPELPEDVPPPLPTSKLMNAGNANELQERLRFLTETFNAFDIDQSGEMDAKELGKLLTYCGVHCDRGVVKHILDDIDVDAGGTIDFDEFLEFFQRISDIETMRMELEAEKQKYDNWAVLMRGYFVVNVIGMFFCGIAFFSGDMGENSTIILGGFIFCLCSFAVILCFGLVMPILKIKAHNSETIKRAKQRVHNAKNRAVQSKEEEELEMQENISRNKNRDGIPPPPAGMDDYDGNVPPPLFTSYRRHLRDAARGDDVDSEFAAQMHPDLETGFEREETEEVADDYNQTYTSYYGYRPEHYAQAQVFYTGSVKHLSMGYKNFNPWTVGLERERKRGWRGWREEENHGTVAQTMTSLPQQLTLPPQPTMGGQSPQDTLARTWPMGRTDPLAMNDQQNFSRWANEDQPYDQPSTPTGQRRRVPAY